MVATFGGFRFLILSAAKIIEPTKNVMRLFSNKTNPVWLSNEVWGEIWHRPPLDRGRDDSSPHNTLQLRPDSAATGPARWRSQLGRTEAALWRMVPGFQEIKSHRPWRRWPFCPRYDIQRDGKPEWKKGQISLDCFKYRRLVRIACQCFFSS